MLLAVGSTDTSIDVQIVDDTGLPVTGLVAATFPAVTISKGTGADIAVTPLSDLSALTDAHSDGGVKERSGGYYRLDCPDTLASTSAAKVTVRAEATGKRLIAPVVQVGYPTVTVKTGTGTGEINLSAGKVPATIAVGDVADNFLTANKIADGAIDNATLAADVRVKLHATQGDYAPAKAGDEMTLTAGTLTTLFSDADVAGLVNSIIARAETDLDASDLSTIAIATLAAQYTRDAILNRVLSGNHDTAGSTGKLLQDAATATALAAVAANATTAATQSASANTAASAAKLVTDKLDTMLTASGLNWQFTVDALENAPAGGGGGSDGFENSPGDYEEGSIGALTAYLAFIPSIKNQTALITTGGVTVVQDNDPYLIEINRGASYLEALGNAITKSDATWSIPAGATVRMDVAPNQRRNLGAAWSVPGTWDEDDNELVSLTFELDDSDTAKAVGDWNYQFYAVTDDGLLPLRSGTLRILSEHGTKFATA